MPKPSFLPPFALAAILTLAAAMLQLFALPAQADDAPSLSSGQLVYVPVYSDVLYGNQDSRGRAENWLLSAMLSIRNTDPEKPMKVRSVRYYDTDGKFIRDYPAERVLGPLATMQIFVEHRDSTGGTGANFLVEWDAETPVNPPVIETVHTYFYGTRAMAFISPGRVIAAGGD